MKNIEQPHEKPIKWGIIGSGKIAGRFAADLNLVHEAVLVGVASRNFENAKIFAHKYETTPFATIEELLKQDIDVIYVATPHPSHLANSILAINSGKSVLCEKPMTMNAAETEKLIRAAREKNVFLMEAMWTRFFPVICKILELIQSGVVGKIQQIEASFGYTTSFDPASRVFNKELGGGALLDVGVYCVSFAHMVLGESPVGVVASAKFGRTGVDEMSEWTLTFPSGAIANGRSAVTEVLSNEALIQGSKGSIRIPNFWHPKEFFLNGDKFESPYDGMGFQFEAREVIECLQAGRKESAKLPHNFSLSVMRSLDFIRDNFDQMIF